MPDENTTAIPTPGQPSESTQASEKTDSSAPMEGLPPNPTGEQAKAYVEAQKAKNRSLEKSPPREEKKEKKEDTPRNPDDAPEPVKKYKVPVDGKEMEVDEKELIRGYSHQKAANKALQEAKRARSEAEQIIRDLRDETKLPSILEKLGIKTRDFSEKFLVSQLEEELMDPRDKELRDAKRRLQQIDEMELNQKKMIEQQRNEDLKKQYADEYTQQFVKALQETNLPPTKPMVAEMARYIRQSAKIGFKMTAQEAAKLVKEDMLENQRRLIGDSDGEDLMKILPPDVANKIRQFDISKIKNPEQYLRTPEQQGEKRKVNGSNNGRMTNKEWSLFKRGL